MENLFSAEFNARCTQLYKKIRQKVRPAGGRLFYRTAMYILLFDLCLVFLFPFLYMMIVSLKTPDELGNITIKWIPRSFHIHNYVIAFNALRYPKGLLNSIFVTVTSTIGHIVFCSCIAYGFARFKFPFRNKLFMLLVLTMIIPVQTIIVPLYMQYSTYKFINTYLPLIVPTFFGFGLKGGIFVFIFRQFFLGLPYELEDAARIDGCNSLKTFRSIVLPSSATAILVTTILSIVWHWNDYFEPVIYLSSSNNWTLPSMLPTMYDMIYGSGSLAGAGDAELVFNEAVALAGTVMVILPILIVYLVLQRKFMQGIERTGLVG